MTMELVRKPASATNGGEFSASPALLRIDTSLGSNLTTLNVTGTAVGRSGALRLLSSDNSLDFYIWAATSTSATNPFAIGTVSNHGFRIMVNDTQAGVVDQSKAWTIGPSAFTGRHSINGQATLNSSNSAPLNQSASSQNAGLSDLVLGRTTTSGSEFGQSFALLAPTINSGNPTATILQTYYSAPGAIGSTYGRFIVQGVASSGGYNSVFEVWLQRGVTSTTPTLRFAVEANSGTVNMYGYGNGTMSFINGTGQVSSSSDSRLKEADVTGTMPGLAEVAQLQPVFFKWKSDIALNGENAERQLGFYAQDVLEVIPEAVGQPTEGNPYYGLYDRPIIAALVNAVKELKARVETLEAAQL